MKNFLKQSAQKGFTLIELIIVITILVILGVVVVVVWAQSPVAVASRSTPTNAVVTRHLWRHLWLFIVLPSGPAPDRPPGPSSASIARLAAADNS